MLRLWSRLLLMDDNRVTKQVFNMDYQKCAKNWSTEIKTILNYIGCSDHYNNRSVISLTDPSNIIRNYYNSVWSIDVQQASKLRTYRVFQTEFNCEDYVKLNLKYLIFNFDQIQS